MVVRLAVGESGIIAPSVVVIAAQRTEALQSPGRQ